MSIQKIASTICENVGYDREAALEELREEVFKDPTLARDAADAYCVWVIANASRDQRHTYFQGSAQKVDTFTKGASRGDKDNVAALKEIAIQNWFALRMPGRIALGDCTKENLQAAFEMWDSQAKSNAERATWCQRLIGLCRTGKTMRQSTTVEAIDKASADFRIDLGVAA